MDNALTQAGVLDTLRSTRSQWEALLAEVGEERMTQRVPGGLWSPKDIVAHIAWYEQQTAEVLQAYNRQATFRDWLWAIAPYKRNAILFTEQQDRPLADVRADAQAAFAQLVAAIAALDEAQIHDPQHFPNMPPTWEPWKFVAIHSYEHYQEHMPSLRAWLDTSDPGVHPLLAALQFDQPRWASVSP